jgi:hypothetical protein
MEEIRTYAVKIGLCISLAKDGEPWWEGAELKEILAENCLDFIKTALNDEPANLAGFIDEIEEIDRRRPDQHPRVLLETRARVDWEEFRGTRVLVRSLEAYVDEEFTNLDFNPPILVYIGRNPASAELRRWCDDWLDPGWYVDVIDKSRLPEGCGSSWIYGRNSYCLDGEVKKNDDWWTVEEYHDWMLEGV